MTEEQNKLPNIKEQDFALWKHHPVTELVMQFLADYRATVVKSIMEDWLAGAVKLSDDQGLRNRVMTIDEFLELNLESIWRFYGYSDPKRGDDSEADQD